MATAMAFDNRYPHTTAGKLAQQLGWFSLALGTLEVVAARRLSRALGMYGQERVIRACGVREIVKGIGILTSPNPAPWVWGRVAGDALDIGTLAMAYPNNAKRANVAIALTKVAAVTALDVICAQQLSATSRRQLPARDYSHRSGFPLGLEASRGLALDAVIPPDMLTPAALRPLNT